MYVLPIGAAFATARRGSRSRLGIVLAAAVGVGFMFGYVVPGGFDGAGDDYLALFFAGTAAGAALGAVVAAVADTPNAWRHVLLGTLGGSAFLARTVGLLLFGLAVTGACLD